MNTQTNQTIPEEIRYNRKRVLKHLIHNNPYKCVGALIRWEMGKVQRCAVGEMLFALGYTDEEIRNMPQVDAEFRVGEKLGINMYKVNLIVAHNDLGRRSTNIDIEEQINKEKVHKNSFNWLVRYLRNLWRKSE